MAEFGDKTQLAIILLASRYGALKVFAGAATAFTLLNALAVGLGALALRLLPVVILKAVVSAVFMLLGLLSLREACTRDAEDEPEKKEGRKPVRGGPIFQVFLLVCFMELGDKTQLALAGLSARYHNPIPVFLGGTAALWLTSLLGAFLGEKIGNLLPRRALKAAAGVLFIAFGVVFLLVDF